jgi:hypothetical protein
MKRKSTPAWREQLTIRVNNITVVKIEKCVVDISVIRTFAYGSMDIIWKCTAVHEQCIPSLHNALLSDIYTCSNYVPCSMSLSTYRDTANIERLRNKTSLRSSKYNLSP